MVSEHTEAFNNKTTSAHNEFNLNKDLRKVSSTYKHFYDPAFSSHHEGLYSEVKQYEFRI